MGKCGRAGQAAGDRQYGVCASGNVVEQGRLQETGDRQYGVCASGNVVERGRLQETGSMASVRREMW